MNLGKTAIELYVAEAAHMNATGRKHPAVMAAKAFIHRHYAEDIDLSMVSRHANMTKEHLIRLFRHHEGTTPTRYMWKVRVDRGVEELRSTGLTIGEISERCGFKSSYHFARTVKNIIGQTPSEIRKESWR